VLLGVLLAIGLSFASPTVWAHAKFVGSTPSADTMLDNAPHEIVLHFSLAVTPVSVSLLGPDGEPVDTGGEATGNKKSVVLAIPQILKPGEYAVIFSVLSGDAHLSTGNLRFSIAAPEIARSAQVEVIEETARTDSRRAKPSVPEEGATEFVSLPSFEQITRAVFVMTLLLALGLVLFRALVPLPDVLDDWVVRRNRVIGSVGLGLTVVYFFVAMIATTGLDAFRPRHLYVLLQTSIGMSLLLASFGFLFLAMSDAAQRILMGTAAALLVVSRVATGHPASQEPVLLLVPSMAIHVATAGFWFASLWVLLRLLHKGPLAEAPSILDRFASVALWSVCALLAAGVLMAAVHLDSFDALLRTEYGNILLWKFLGVAGLLVSAVVNKIWLTPRLATNYEPSALVRSIRLEAILMVAVIATSTILAATPPAAKASETVVAGTSHSEHVAFLFSRGGPIEQ
jgi:putative copper export protein/methionine-rich copper-binding protein CopC